LAVSTSPQVRQKVGVLVMSFGVLELKFEKVADLS
jgi:hypothetical protein